MKIFRLLIVVFILFSNVYGQERQDTSLPSLIPYRKGNLWGFCDQNKKLVIPAKYEWAQPFKKGRAIVYFDREEKGVYAVIDSTGTELVRTHKDTTLTIEYDGTVTATKGFYNILFTIEPNGKFFRPKKYKPTWKFNDNLYVAKKGKRYGVIDENEKVIIPFKYNLVFPVEGEKYFVVKDKNDRRGFMDMNQKLLMPYFDKGVHVGGITEGLIRIGVGEEFKQLYGFIDTTGKTVIPVQYKEAFGFTDGVCIVSNGVKWGGINTKGDTVIPFKYKVLRWLPRGRLEFGDSTSYGVMDTKGKEFFRKKGNQPLLYLSDDILTYEITYREGNATGIWYGAMDINGKEILPPEYMGIWCNGPGLISIIEKDGKSYYMDFRFNKYYED